MSSILNRVAHYQHGLKLKSTNVKSIVGLVQFSATEDVNDNFEKCAKHIKECAGKGARMVCLPEHFAYMNQDKQHFQKIYLTENYKALNQDLFKAYRELALENRVWLSLGCFPEEDSQSGKPFLTHSIIDDEGNVVAKYRKMHMFDIDLKGIGSVNQRESKIFKKGNKICEPCFSPLGYLGLSISYDIRFPELYRHMTLRGA